MKYLALVQLLLSHYTEFAALRARIREAKKDGLTVIEISDISQDVMSLLVKAGYDIWSNRLLIKR